MGVYRRRTKLREVRGVKWSEMVAFALADGDFRIRYRSGNPQNR